MLYVILYYNTYIYYNYNQHTDDHSRVTITPIEGHPHDYINANFLSVCYLSN